MSIRRYFILGISLIFLVLATSQALLVLYFKDQVRHDISTQSQVITKKLIGKAREDINQRIIEFSPVAPIIRQQSENNNALAHPPPPLPPEAASAPKAIKQVHKFILDIDINANPEVEMLNQAELSKELRTLFIQLESDDNIQHIIDDEFSSLTTSNSFDKFASLILWSIVISSLVAIVLMAYFAHALTRPIAALNAGFLALGHGQLGSQVKPQGVAEIASCINHFNHTSLRLAQLSATEKQLEQQRHLVELGELSRAVAHSLRNPIHTLSLTLEQYWHNHSEQQRQHLQHIAHNKIAHLNKNIAALLTLSNSELSRNQLVPISAVIQDILLELGTEQTHFELELEPHLAVQGLESEIRTILHTVIVNALEANLQCHQKNHQHNSIKISSQQQRQQVCISISDQGPGFSPSILEQLFEPHVSSKADGAGMGLYLANRLANLYYQGNISVKNQSQGATVTITLSSGLSNE